MATGEDRDITQMLALLGDGDERAAEELLPLVYDRLHALAGSYLRRERAGHTLQPTALVHDAYLRLVDQDRVDWKGRSHFFAIGAQMMRRILVNHARSKARLKRGGDRQRVELHENMTVSHDNPEQVLALDEVLTQLAQAHPRRAKLVEMRFFAGMNMDEIAVALDISKRTVEKDWTLVRAWLRRALSDPK